MPAEADPHKHSIYNPASTKSFELELWSSDTNLKNLTFLGVSHAYTRCLASSFPYRCTTLKSDAASLGNAPHSPAGRLVKPPVCSLALTSAVVDRFAPGAQFQFHVRLATNCTSIRCRGDNSSSNFLEKLFSIGTFREGP